MVTRLALLLLVLQLHQAANSPMRAKRSSAELPHQPVLISAHAVPVVHHHVFAEKRQLSLLAPIPVSQLYIHPKLHVIPANCNLVHNSVQHIVTKDNVKIPILHAPVQNTTYTHSNLVPILIPIHSIVTTGNHLIPVHDLSVIPLQRNKVEKLAQYRMAMEHKEEEHEESNQYRNFYGGYGTGLFFGGHGSGHGFYAYGK